MRAGRLATVAILLIATFSYASPVSAQVLFTTGVGVCLKCGHSELDTRRYVHSFLNQLFFPNTVVRRTSVAVSLYLFTATYTMHGRLSPDPEFSSVTIAITAEIKNMLPTGNYHVTVSTPGGKTSKATYAIGNQKFDVNEAYAPGARRLTRADRYGSGAGGNSGPGTNGRSGPGGSSTWQRQGRPAACSRSRMEANGNETIVYCSTG